ncbi:Glycosyl transferase family 2 [Burkholderia sp. 8Y]|uniref:glycosyltransferase family 2 protein n=1 Tax=Burkholderia sp. 8Y TaxID=2653133 RepID=UPI0012EF9A8C|nr:glycosyltransferase family 2 protein [Burkholderia sp. 8Y]VXB55390.1 Glycosyl transferase family 2 [Burkholderia sp. 8Y]
MPSNAEVSVVIPCFNAAASLARAINSCLDQREVAQVILVDDGSDDASLDVARTIAFTDPRVKVMGTVANGGAARARNLGALHATHPLLAFLDADDEYLPGGLARAVSTLRTTPEHHVVRLNVTFKGYPPDILAFRGFAHHVEIMNNMITSSLVIRRTTFLALGGFPEDDVYRQYGGEDGTFQSAIMVLFGCIRLTGTRNVCNHYHPNSHVARYFRRMMGELDSPPEAVQQLGDAVHSFVARARSAWEEHVKGTENSAPATRS